MRDHDVVVLGGGSGSQVATAAANAGYDAAVVEPGPLGGACITRGCVPSKALIHRADVCETIRGAERFGVDADLHGVDYAAITETVHDTVFAKADRQAETLRSMDGLTLYEATGRFVDGERAEDTGYEIELVDSDPDGVPVGGASGEAGGDADVDRIRTDRVVIAVGGRPTVPPIDGIDDVDVLTSDGALYLDEQPDRLAVVGGGYIAAELGHFFDAIGTTVSIVGRSDVLVPRESAAASDAVTRALDRRCDVYAGYEATEVREADADGDTVLAAEPTDQSGEGGDDVEIRADEVLVAAGRRPNTDGLRLDAIGVTTDDDGHVEVDETLATDAPRIWALGDVLAEFPFKHVADREAEIVAKNVLATLDSEDGPSARPDPDRLESIDRDALPHAIFTDPRVASVGATASELDDAGTSYESARVEYAVAPLGLIIDETDAFVEVLAEPDGGAILGCHVVGPDAPVLLQEVVTAMAVGEGTVDEVVGTVHVHPALSEVVLGAFDELSTRSISTAPDWRDVVG